MYKSQYGVVSTFLENQDKYDKIQNDFILTLK